VGGNFVEVIPEQTQTEITPGWKIVDIQMKSKSVRYLSGKHARQMTDDQTPRLLISPSQKETLVDYAFIKLRKKRGYRVLPDPNLRENAYLRIEPPQFDIKILNDSTFECRPVNLLDPGEYILVNIAQQPKGEMLDYTVYPLRIP